MSMDVEIRAVVFDLDGTMLNTEDIFEEAGQQLMVRRGLQMTDSIRRAMLGRRPHEAFTALKSLTSLPDKIEDLMAETKQIFGTLAENSLAIMPGLSEILSITQARQLPRAVATSSPRAYLQWLLQKLQLEQHFEFALTAEDVTHGKPHPEIYELAARRLGVHPSQMLVLEDSETGTQAAAAAGAFVVAVPNRHTDYGDFSMSHLRIDSLLDPRLHTLLHGLSHTS
jgi:HAD superfamily hydrolase (TIGR01509 family)